jgi:hypothetical protein
VKLVFGMINILNDIDIIRINQYSCAIVNLQMIFIMATVDLTFGDLTMTTEKNDVTPTKPVKEKLAKKEVTASKAVAKKKAVKPAVKKKAAKPAVKKKSLANAVAKTAVKKKAIKPVSKKKAIKPVSKKKVVKPVLKKKGAVKKAVKGVVGASPAVIKIKVLKENLAELNQELADLKAETKLAKKRENATALLASQREAAANKFLRGWDKKANAALEKSLAIKKKKKKKAK